VSGDLLVELARRYAWWLPAAQALARPNHLLCQLMQLGTAEDVRAARDLLGDEAFRDALRSAPPGILDARSWNFWHLVLLGQPPPPPPLRPLPP
jgi:GAF domain-containing protein